MSVRVAVTGTAGRIGRVMPATANDAEEIV
jgi:dihydrodipicolinate reductase